MAQGTTDQPVAPPRMAPTPGVGAAPPNAGGMRPSTTGIAQTPETEGAEPVLFEDLDPVLLTRLYPDSFVEGMGEAQARAIDAGWQAHEDGLNLIANVQEDEPLPESGTSAPPTRRASSHRPQTAPARKGEAGLHGQPTAAGQAFPAQQHADEQHHKNEHDKKEK